MVVSRGGVPMVPEGGHVIADSCANCGTKMAHAFMATANTLECKVQQIKKLEQLVIPVLAVDTGNILLLTYR